MQLLADEYTQYQQKIGELTQKEFNRIIKLGSYNASKNNKKIETLQKILSSVKKDVENEILKSINLKK